MIRNKESKKKNLLSPSLPPSLSLWLSDWLFFCSPSLSPSQILENIRLLFFFFFLFGTLSFFMSCSFLSFTLFKKKFLLSILSFLLFGGSIFHVCWALLHILFSTWSQACVSTSCILRFGPQGYMSYVYMTLCVGSEIVCTWHDTARWRTVCW